MPLVFKVDPSRPDDLLVQEAAAAVRNGGIIIYPTETFYGLGALYSDERALKRLFEIKGRDLTKPVLLLIRDTGDLSQLTAGIAGPCLALAEKFWPGPLTLLFHASPHLSPLLAGRDAKIGCRISPCTIAQRLLFHVQAPLTSTSANLSGGPSPVTIHDIPEQLLSCADVILDGGVTPGGLPSTVLDTTEEPYAVIRHGAIPAGRLLQGPSR